jgi:hypothetical protein
MINDKHYDIHHIIHSIINIKKYNYWYNEKNIYWTIHLDYSIIWKPIQFRRKKTELKTLNKIQMRFWGSRWYFFCPENDETEIVVNPVDLVARFLWPHSTPQSKFAIKSYGRLKLRLSDFSFYFFCLSSLFLISFLFLFSISLSLSSLFLYMKTDENRLVIRGIFVFEF